MNNKYELTDEIKNINGTALRQIRALRDISRWGVKAGDLGGWIEKEENLSHYGDAWVSGNAMVYGDAWVHGDAKVCGDAKVYGDAMVAGDAKVYGDAMVAGDAWVYGDAKVYGDADYMTFKNSWSSGRWFTYTRSNKMWAVGCFHGTGEELIKKAYADSEVSGKCYEAIVRAVEAIEVAKGDAK